VTRNEAKITSADAKSNTGAKSGADAKLETGARQDAVARIVDFGPEDAVFTARFIHETGQAGVIAGLAEPVLDSLGFRLIRVYVSGRDGGTLQIMAERPDGTISVDDCAIISRNLSPVLDANDPMQSSYRLEISSPGIDRPLVRPKDFEDWAGFEARIEVKELVGGRRRFRGRLDGFEAGEVRIEIEADDGSGKVGPQIIGVPMGLIEQAKLVMTDDLIRAALKAQSAQEAAIVEAAAERSQQ
jgi:ribosome maturation factor RimP